MSDTNTQSFAYFWVNGLYMREIQWGIQALHCAVDMGQLYGHASLRHSAAGHVFHKWADFGKTVILLNGFNVAGLQSKFDLMSDHAVAAGVPWASFSEDEQSLGGVLTCVGVVPNENMMRYMDWAKEASKLWTTPEMLRTEWERTPGNTLSFAEQAIADDLRQGRLVS